MEEGQRDSELQLESEQETTQDEGEEQNESPNQTQDTDFTTTYDDEEADEQESYERDEEEEEQENDEEEETYQGATESGQSSSRRNQTATCPSEKLTKIIAKKAQMRSQRPDDPSNPIRRKDYLKHRNRVKTAKSLVDSCSPFAAKMTYTNKSYNNRLLNFARIERENTIMLQHLADIIHGKGKIDNKWERTIRGTNNRGQTRQMKLLHITFDNLALLKRIQAQKPFYSRQEQLAEYRRNEQVMTQLSYYPLFWHLKDSCKWGSFEGKARANANSRPRARCFLEIGNQCETFGKVIIDVFAFICPYTAENFRALCTGEYGMSYKCSTIHRVIPDLLWQGGDITGQGGTGNKSIYGDSFPDENFKLKHDKAGTISMANCGPNSNGSQFIIAAKPLQVLDGSNVVFGQVVGGMNVLKSLYKKVASSGRLKKKFWIIDCGELDPGSSISEDENEEEEEEEDEEEDEEDEEEEYDYENDEENDISEPTTYATEEEDNFSESGAIDSTDTGDNSGPGTTTTDEQ